MLIDPSLPGGRHVHRSPYPILGAPGIQRSPSSRISLSARSQPLKVCAQWLSRPSLHKSLFPPHITLPLSGSAPSGWAAHRRASTSCTRASVPPCLRYGTSRTAGGASTTTCSTSAVSTAIYIGYVTPRRNAEATMPSFQCTHYSPEHHPLLYCTLVVLHAGRCCLLYCTLGLIACCRMMSADLHSLECGVHSLMPLSIRPAESPSPPSPLHRLGQHAAPAAPLGAAEIGAPQPGECAPATGWAQVRGGAPPAASTTSQ